jgi:ribosome-binding factor A
MKELLNTKLISFLISSLDGANSTLILKKLKDITVSDDPKVAKVFFNSY